MYLNEILLNDKMRFVRTPDFWKVCIFSIPSCLYNNDRLITNLKSGIDLCIYRHISMFIYVLTCTQ